MNNTGIYLIELNAPTVVGALVVFIVGVVLLCWAHDLLMKDQDERIDKIFNLNNKHQKPPQDRKINLGK